MIKGYPKIEDHGKEVNSQQPEVLACQGEGESTESGSRISGVVETGKPTQYPSADLKNEINKLKWMEEEFVKETDNMIKIMEKQRNKIHRIKKEDKLKWTTKVN